MTNEPLNQSAAQWNAHKSTQTHRGVLLDGKALAAKVRAELKAKVAASPVRPGLTVIRVGEDPASKTYVNSKVKACAEVGIDSKAIVLDENTSESELLVLIGRLNRDESVHGILVQLPLPKHMNEQRVIQAIAPSKDVDGFHPVNMGRLTLGLPCPVACTPKGILRILDDAQIQIAGKKVVVVGRSNIVGKPVALLMLQRSATVTLCHSKTQNLPDEVKQADILIAAVGREGLIRPEWIKPGAVIIDVGINRGADGKLHGDVAPECAAIASAMTPVPGGVGPMTVAMLLENTLELAQSIL